ncbi:hypothetical protein L2E82_05761 [Cichorium intybus]|uniref:Uncharacterized protein n=1 Tax=Cichorium intybus TaxID=13427 RepID=A0ACB9H9A9_CICIN|nr:hypothetical protein L2E82_05761 [Cichorium intybus]
MNVCTISMSDKSQLLVPMFELKDGTDKCSLKYCKQMYMLSLDSRATVDSKGSLCPREVHKNDLVVSAEKELRVFSATLESGFAYRQTVGCSVGGIREKATVMAISVYVKACRIS